MVSAPLASRALGVGLQVRSRSAGSRIAPGVTKSAALFDLIADAAERLKVVVVGAIE